MRKLALALLLVCAVVGVTQARVITAEWDSWAGALDAEWDSYGDLTAVMPADFVTSDPVIPNIIADGYLFYSDEFGNEYPTEFQPFLYDTYGQGADERSDVLELNVDNQLVFELDNYQDGDFKELFLEVTYYDNGVESEIFPIDQSEGSDIDRVEYLGWELDGMWVTEFWKVTYVPNPSWEAIAIDFNGFMGSPDYPALIDSVYIETECVPEPVTVSLLALGAVAGFRRKK